MPTILYLGTIASVVLALNTFQIYVVYSNIQCERDSECDNCIPNKSVKGV